MVGDELIMQLTAEQGPGRESQVQPPVEIWRRYFNVDEHAEVLPVLRLINARAPEEELEPPRPVVEHDHNYTVELRGARGSRPAITRITEIGRQRYEYAVYRPADIEYAAYDRLLNEVDNPLRTHGRLWFIAPRRRRSAELWWPTSNAVEQAVRGTRRAAAESNEVEAARETMAELAGAPAEGQGYASFSERRKAIEDRAMSEATRFFEGRGYTVRDVSRTRSYDLECTHRREPLLHVEVKGTTSRGGSVLLTANEVQHARDFPNTALFVLAGIRVNGDPSRASGGRRRLLNPWQLVEENLEPLAFAYTLG